MRRLASAFVVALVTTSAGATTVPDPSDGLSGAEVTDLVQQAMEAADISGRAQISTHRGFPACAHLPEVAPSDQGWRTITLSCSSPTWERAVRSAALTAGPAIGGDTDPPAPGDEVVILAESVNRGTVLERHHLAHAPAPASGLAGTFSDLEDLLGRRMAVNLGAGRRLQARHLEEDWLVTRDAPVAIDIAINGVSVSTAGVAVDAGQRGDRIRVRNARSGRVIQAEIVSENRVVVQPNMN